MYDFALIELSMKAYDFWRLSWYDMSCYLEGHRRRAKQHTADQEMEWARMRIMWADFHNAHRNPKKSKIVRPTDLIRLSFDDMKLPVEARVIDMEAMKKRFGSKIKSKKVNGAR